MLDGLLGRGFASKCKSLIKSVTKRIDVIRKKRNATQKFLKKDIADLLANGLDINAYGRAEGLLVELKVSSCYDFVEHCSDFVIKHLLILQKLSTCPEDCREAVSSLMFAAARFSDLPELRDLREMLQKKYGNSLEHFVNQEFVENLASKPANLERKVQLMRNIALEFLITWDSVAFEKRMSRPPVNTMDEPKTYGSSLNASNGRSKYSNGKETESRGDKHELANGGHRFLSVINDDVSRRIELTYPTFNNGNEICNGKVEEILTVDSHGGMKATAVGGHEIDCRKGETAMETLTCGSISLGNRQEQRIGRSILCNGREIAVKHGGDPRVLHNVRLDAASSHVGEALKVADKKPPHVNRQREKQDSMESSEMLHENENRKLKSNFKSSLPPYINSSSRTKDYNPANCKSPISDNDNNPSFAGCSEQLRSIGGSENSLADAGHSKHEREKHKQDFRHDEKDRFYDARLSGNSLPKPRSTRRKHSKSRSNYDVSGDFEDTCVTRRKSRSRRRDESKGLKLLMDEEKHHKDEEEMMIDKLLIHYSKKPSKLDPAKARKKPRSHRMGELPRLASLESIDNNSDTIHSPDMVPLAARSFSLPQEEIGQSEGSKVYVRAASFQPNGFDEAKHVYPNLPDYEDLTARFAAMRGK